MRLSNWLPNQFFSASISLLLLLTLCVDLHVKAYEMPAVKIVVYSPKGFDVSIPDEEGRIKFFTFRGKLDKEMDFPWDATWEQKIVKASNGRWTFRDEITLLKIGDTFHYWTSVLYNGLVYDGDDGVYVVRGYENRTTPEVINPDDNSGGDTDGMPEYCFTTETVMNGGKPVACSQQIIFEDEFSGSHLDTHKWKLEHRFPPQPDYEFVMYLDDVPDIVSLWNGMVTIAPKTTEQHFRSVLKPLEMLHKLGIRCTGDRETDCYRYPTAESDIIPPFISAQFSTKNRFSFKYGRIEIRAKLPCIEWVFPQLWLQPVANIYGLKDYQSGQMRIAFSQVNATGLQLFGGVVLNAKEPWRTLQMCHLPLVGDWCNDFHVYELMWTNIEVQIIVDGIKYCSFDFFGKAPSKLRSANGTALPNRSRLEEGNSWAPFDQEFYITLGYGIGGLNDFKDDPKEWKNPKPWNNSHPKVMKNFWESVKNDTIRWLGRDDMRIDYVRVYSV